MEKLIFVEQPPQSEKFRMLVDDCIDTGNYGFATDKDKVNYNLELLGIREHVLLQAAQSAQGMNFISPAGRFVVISKVKNDHSSMSMNFYDFRSYSNFRELNATVLQHAFSDIVVGEFEKVCDYITQSYKEEEDDKVELVRVI